MTNAGDRWAVICGWTLSVLIHAVSLGAAIVIAANFSLVPRPRPFQWDVSLVMAPRPEPIVSELSSPSAPGPVSPQSTTDSQISQSDISPQADTLVKNRKTSRSTLDMETLPSNLHVEKVAVADMANDQSTDQELPASHPEVTKDSEDSVTAAIAPNDAFTTTVDLANLPVSRPGSEEFPPPDVDTSHPAPMVSEPAFHQPEQPFNRPSTLYRDPVVSRVLHADYGWLANVLFTKVEQIKRYPHLAKNNRWQGNVVLQAAITEDGQVADITVVKSSGHAMLDQDAVTLLERASPVDLEYPLGQPQVVVQIPIGYRLE